MLHRPSFCLQSEYTFERQRHAHAPDWVHIAADVHKRVDLIVEPSMGLAATSCTPVTSCIICQAMLDMATMQLTLVITRNIVCRLMMEPATGYKLALTSARANHYSPSRSRGSAGRRLTVSYPVKTRRRLDSDYQPRRTTSPTTLRRVVGGFFGPAGRPVDRVAD
jgi:hypothetical protein